MFWTILPEVLWLWCRWGYQEVGFVAYMAIVRKACFFVVVFVLSEYCSNPYMSDLLGHHYTSGFDSHGHLAMWRAILVVTAGDGVGQVLLALVGEPRDATKHPMGHRTAPLYRTIQPHMSLVWHGITWDSLPSLHPDCTHFPDVKWQLWTDQHFHLFIVFFFFFLVKAKQNKASSSIHFISGKHSQYNSEDYVQHKIKIMRKSLETYFQGRTIDRGQISNLILSGEFSACALDQVNILLEASCLLPDLGKANPPAVMKNTF